MSNFPDDIDYQNKSGNSPFRDDREEQEEYEPFERVGYTSRDDYWDYRDEVRDNNWKQR